MDKHIIGYNQANNQFPKSMAQLKRWSFGQRPEPQRPGPKAGLGAAGARPHV